LSSLDVSLDRHKRQSRLKKEKEKRREEKRRAVVLEFRVDTLVPVERIFACVRRNLL